MQERNEDLAIHVSETWLYGFAAGKRGEETMDPAVYRQFSDDLFAACVKNRGQRVLDAAMKIKLQSRPKNEG